MSTHNDTFHLPFISNLLPGKGVAHKVLFSQRAVQMKEKALCLDDDPLSLRLVEHLLKERYAVISCATIDSAIRAIKRNTVGLFLCDYHLGERFTGAQAYERLRDEFGFRPIHRILITSYPSPEIEAETLASGFDRVFAKPLRKEFQAHCLNLRMPRIINPVAAG
jgi:CheY-like chemotaxis protein